MSPKSIDEVETGDGRALADAGPVVGFIVAIFFMNMLSRLGLAPLMPHIERDLPLSHAEAGGLFLLLSMGYGVGLFSSPFLSARFRHRQMIVGSSVAVGGMLAVCGWSASPWGLRLALMGLGVSGGLYLPSGVATLTGVVRKGDWGKVLAIQQLAPNFAYILSPFVAELLMRRYDWRMVLMVYGGASILMGLVFAASRPAGDFRGTPPSPAVFLTFLRNPAAWGLVLLFSLALGVNQGVFSMMPLYLTAERGLTPSRANGLISLSRLIAFGAPLVTGWVSDRWGLRRTLFGVVLASGLSTLLLVVSAADWIAAGLVFQAVSSVCFFPLGFAALSRITRKENRNVAVALIIPCAHLIGAGLIPVIIGIAGDAGSFDWGFILLGGLTLAGVSVIRFLGPD